MRGDPADGGSKRQEIPSPVRDDSTTMLTAIHQISGAFTPSSVICRPFYQPPTTNYFSICPEPITFASWMT
jgi:hypothetical protein